MRRAAALGALVFLVAAAPAAGHSVMKVESGTIFYNATDDVALNKLSVTREGSQIRFYDPGAAQGITAPTECSPGELDSQGNPIEIFCPSAGMTKVRIDVGEAQDEAIVDLPIAALIVGGNGADRIATTGGDDIVNGGEGNDDIRTAAGNDAVVGGGGDDTIVTEDGNDTVQGGLGVDTIDTGNGDDDVRIRDGSTDQAVCGAGNDRAQVEDADRLTDCETVDRLAGTGGDPGAPPGTSPTGEPAPRDTTAPRLRAGGVTRQRLRGRSTVLVAAVVSEASELYATGFVDIGRRRFALGQVRAAVTFGGGGVELRVPLDRPALRAARRALRHKRLVRVIVSVLATDRAGNSTPARLPRITLH